MAPKIVMNLRNVWRIDVVKVPNMIMLKNRNICPKAWRMTVANRSNSISGYAIMKRIDSLNSPMQNVTVKLIIIPTAFMRNINWMHDTKLRFSSLFLIFSWKVDVSPSQNIEISRNRSPVIISLLLFWSVSLCSNSSIEKITIPIVIITTASHLVIEYVFFVRSDVKIMTDIGLHDLLRTFAGYETYSERFLYFLNIWAVVLTHRYVG